MDIDEITIDEHAGKDLDSDYFYISVAVLIVETRKTSQFLQLLAEKLPLSALGLQHIKRVRKGDNNNKTVEIVLIPVDQIESVDKEIWSKCGLEGGILNNHASVKIVRVAKFLPKNRREFSIWGSKWPVNFYPDEIERQRELGLSEQEVTYITSIIHTLLDLHSHSHIHHTSHEKALTESIHGLNLALIANPTTGNVVCTSAQGLSRLQEQLGDSASAHTHPLYLPTLLCINQVAAICRGDVDGKGE
ncbi:hypothetical protein EON65_18805 [archaeon]|nr:MAG: hypothetical protein EON65_18805 [archaeon]